MPETFACRFPRLDKRVVTRLSVGSLRLATTNYVILTRALWIRSQSVSVQSVVVCCANSSRWTAVSRPDYPVFSHAVFVQVWITSVHSGVVKLWLHSLVITINWQCSLHHSDILRGSPVCGKTKADRVKGWIGTIHSIHSPQSVNTQQPNLKLKWL